jgi:hypothetical protein
MEFNTTELQELKALVYKEIMGLERINHKEKSLLFRKIYNKLKEA